MDDRPALLIALGMARESWIGYRACDDHEQAAACLMFMDTLLDQFLLTVRGA
jgi:hypothetical protein